MPIIGSISRLAAAGFFAACLSLGPDPAEALYDIKPGEIKGKPGTVIRVWPLEGGGSGNSEAFRFIYRSTGLKGESIPVSDLIAMALLSWARLKNVKPATIVKPGVLGAFNKTARGCLTSIAQFKTLEDNVKPLQTGQRLKFDPTQTQPWKGIMLKNTPGQAPAGGPVFIAQGTADQIVQPHVTKQFAKALCAKGVKVTFISLRGTSHIFAGRDAAPAAIRWMDDRFRGRPAPSSCP